MFLLSLEINVSNFMNHLLPDVESADDKSSKGMSLGV